MSLALLFNYLQLKMFRMSVHPSSGACDLLWIYFMCCIAPPQPNHTVTPTHIEPEQYNTWNKSILSRKLLRMDVLTFETCWAVNSEIIKQVISRWSLFIQLLCKSRYQTETQSWHINKHQAVKDVHSSVSHKLYCVPPLTQEVKWHFPTSCHHESLLPVESG